MPIFLSFLSSQEIVTVLPRVNHASKTSLETTYAELRKTACDRILIYKRTLQASSLFTNPDCFQYSQLSGGYSNTTFRIGSQGSWAYVSRIAGAGSEQFIDREAEWHNATIAADLELNPRIHFNDKRGNQLSQWLSSPQPMTPEMLAQNPDYLAQIALKLQQLHQSSKQFKNNANIFNRNQAFYRIIESSDRKLPEAYAPIKALANKVEALFKQLEIPQVPCHNDTFFNNFLISGDKLWLIDWEYSGNHDSMWDLAYFCKLAGLNKEQKIHFFSTYFNCQNYQQEYHLDYLRVIAYSITINDFLILWTFTQLANKNVVVENENELMKWAEDALEDSQRLIKDEEFNKAITLLNEAAESGCRRGLPTCTLP